eukprot:5259366-Amphidinium_carterae.1
MCILPPLSGNSNIGHRLSGCGCSYTLDFVLSLWPTLCWHWSRFRVKVRRGTMNHHKLRLLSVG